MTSDRSQPGTSVYGTILESTVVYGHRPFLHIPAVSCQWYHDGPIDLSYQQLGNLVETARDSYARAGYGKGQRVAILLENRPDFFVHWFALNALGVSVVPINGELAVNEMAYLLSHSEACLGVSVANKQATMQEAADHAGLSLPIVTTQDPLPPAPGTSADQIINRHTECALLYTSGSTGKPKGCMLNNEYFVASGDWYRNMGGLCHLEPGVERLLTPLPLVHMNAMACSTMAMVMTGGCLIQLDRFHPSNWWQTVSESGASIVHYLGVMPAILLNRNSDANEDFSTQIKFGFGAGGPGLRRRTIVLHPGLP